MGICSMVCVTELQKGLEKLGIKKKIECENQVTNDIDSTDGWTYIVADIFFSFDMNFSKLTVRIKWVFIKTKKVVLPKNIINEKFLSILFCFVQ